MKDMKYFLNSRGTIEIKYDEGSKRVKECSDLQYIFAGATLPVRDKGGPARMLK